MPYEEGSSDQTRVVPDSCSTIFRPFNPIQHHHHLDPCHDQSRSILRIFQVGVFGNIWGRIRTDHFIILMYIAELAASTVSDGEIICFCSLHR
jgi:hypothetical protein